MAGDGFALCGRKWRKPNRSYSSTVDGQTRRTDEHQQGVHKADQEKTEKPDRAHGRARHQGADREETCHRRGVFVQEQNANGVCWKRGYSECRQP